MVGKRYYTIEYLDDEGDCCIKHMTATPLEIEMLIGGFAAKGILASAYEIAPSGVIYENEEGPPQLEPGD